MTRPRTNITVLGDGAWGTTLAMVLDENNHDTVLWGAFAQQVKMLQTTRTNEALLPGIMVPESIAITDDLKAAVEHAQYIVTAVPSHAVRSVCRNIKDMGIDVSGKNFINVAKGIESGSLMTMCQIITQELGTQNVCSLSGPSHAEEVARKVPTAIVAASENEQLATNTQQLFNTSSFRVYSSTDTIGVEIGGSLKNVIAIATGICDGLGLGDNTKAALITRGLHEMSRLGVCLGANPQTLAGLSGLGDLIVTCTSKHSRNRWFGQEIGQGLSAEQALAKTQKVVEGYKTAFSAFELAQKTKIQMPICQQIHDILYKGKKPDQAVSELMSRSIKPELLI